MSYKEAQETLRQALRTQKTIRTSKLSRLLQSMNISLKKNNDTQEVNYLRNEIKKLIRANKKLKGKRK